VPKVHRSCGAIVVLLAACLSVSTPAGGAEFPVVRKPTTMNYELGLRYWYGWGSTAKNLYDTSGSMLVSRLTYDQFQSHSGELFGRVDHSSGWFVKANLGAGAIVQGRLKD
jgi:hypothetical protein